MSCRDTSWRLRPVVTLSARPSSSRWLEPTVQACLGTCRFGPGEGRPRSRRRFSGAWAGRAACRTGRVTAPQHGQADGAICCTPPDPQIHVREIVFPMQTPLHCRVEIRSWCRTDGDFTCDMAPWPCNRHSRHHLVPSTNGWTTLLPAGARVWQTLFPFLTSSANRSGWTVEHLSSAVRIEFRKQEHTMAGKEQKRGNREMKKPKKTPSAAVVPAAPAKPGATPIRVPKKD